MPAKHIDQKKDIMDLLATKNFKKAAELAHECVREYPADVEYRLMEGAALTNAKKYRMACKAMERAVKQFPDSWQCFSILGGAYGFLHDLQKTEEAYRRALASASGASKAERADICCNLADVLWARSDRDSALALWREALVIDPSNTEAKQCLEECTNEYNEPTPPSEVFNDLYHFQRIHTERYLADKGKMEFESKREAERVIGAIFQVWNDRLAPQSKELDVMTPAEKTELFQSISVDFSK